MKYCQYVFVNLDLHKVPCDQERDHYQQGTSP